MFSNIFLEIVGCKFITNNDSINPFINNKNSIFLFALSGKLKISRFIKAFFGPP